MSPEEKIRKSITSGRISHAYIFEGSRISGKEKAARSFLSAVSGIADLSADPDHYEVRAEAAQGRTVRSIKDADLEKLQEDLRMKPQRNRNTALIYDADTMTVRAQNRFLKTLEEPTPGTVIILLSENTENLLETIRSRCVIYRFPDDENGGDEYSGDWEDLIEKILDNDSFHNIKKSLTQEIKTREDAYLLLDILEQRFRDIMIGKDKDHPGISKEKAMRSIELTEETRRALLGNAIVNYALRRLALKIQEN